VGGEAERAGTEQRRIAGGRRTSAIAAPTSFVAGITEPIEFPFVAPALYAIRAAPTATARFVADTLDIRRSFTFSRGGIGFPILDAFGVHAGDRWMTPIHGPICAAVHDGVFTDQPPPSGPVRSSVRGRPRRQGGRRSRSGSRRRPPWRRRKSGVVVASPTFDDGLRFGQGVEDLPIERFVPQAGVEALDETVLHGRPGVMQAVSAPTAAIRSPTISARNSGPPSERTCSGPPRRTNGSESTSTTSTAFSRRAMRIAGHSWVNSSTTFGMRYVRPSWVRSSTKS
jgi:hypothetical protein